MSQQKGVDFNVVVVAEQEPLFHRRILEAARQFGDDDIALTDCETGESLTFMELRRKSIQLAAILHAQLGLGPHGGPLLCLWPNCVQYPLVLLAGALIGAPCSGAPADSSIEDLTLFLAKTGCQAVFATDACPQLDWLAQEAASRGIPLILLWDNDGHMDEKMDDENQQLTMGLDFHRLLEEGARLVDTEEQIQEWLATGPDRCLSPNHPFAAPLSSGASGVPKVVLQTHRNYIGATQILKNAVFDELTTKGGGRRTTIAAQPFCHASGLWILCYCLLTGHRSLVMRKFQPFLYLELIKEHKIDTLSLGPWLISLLLKQNLGVHDLSSVRTIISGGSSEATNALQNAQFLEHFPAVENFLIGYGMTEIVLISHLTPLGMDHGDERRLHSVGKLLPGFEHKIVECVSGNDLTNIHQPNARGELWLLSECVMAGYLNDPLLTELAIDGEGWFHTGDVVYTDADGFFFVVDRLSNMILVDGHQVWPAELESALLRHPDVLEACVLGAKQKEDISSSAAPVGEVPMALVVLKKSPEKSGEECQREQSTMLLLLKEIRDFANAHLNEHQQLRGGILAVESLPKTPFGKVARQKVKAMVKRMEEEGKGFWVGRDEEKLGRDEEKFSGKDEEEMAGKDEDNVIKKSGRDEDGGEEKIPEDILLEEEEKEQKRKEVKREENEDDEEEGEEMAVSWMLEEMAKSEKKKKSEEENPDDDDDDDDMKHLHPWDEQTDRKPEEKKEGDDDKHSDSIEAEIGTSGTTTTINKKVSFDLDGKKEVNFVEEALVYEAKPADEDEEEWEVKKEIIKIDLDECMEEIKKKKDDDDDHDEKMKEKDEEKEEKIDRNDEEKLKKLMKKPKTSEEEKKKYEEKKEEEEEKKEDMKKEDATKEETNEDEERKEEMSMIDGKMKPAAEEEKETITICHPEEFDDDEYWQKALLEETMNRALMEAAEIGANSNNKKKEEDDNKTVEKEVDEEEEDGDGDTILL